MTSLEWRSPALVPEQATLDYEEEELYAQISANRRRRNGYAFVNRLPNELLTMIFLFALANQHRSSMRLTRLPLNVSQVCSRWREIALSTGRLWRQICLGARSNVMRCFVNEYYRLATDWVSERMRRAKAVSLDIFLWQPNQNVMNAISTQLVRVRCLHIVTTIPNTFLFAREQFFIRDMPLLEDLSVFDAQTQSYGSRLSLFPFGTSTRSLRTLKLKYIALQTCVGDDTWRNLVALHLNHSVVIERFPADLSLEQLRNSYTSIVQQMVTSEQSWVVLRKATNLEVLSLNGVRIASFVHAPVICLAKLTDFRFWPIEDDDLVVRATIEFFQHIEMPNLRALQITGANSSSYPDFSDLFHLLASKLSRVLESLTISWACFEPAALLELLAELSQLRILRLQHTTVAVETIKGLRSRDGVLICPSLVELDMSQRILRNDSIPNLAAYRPFTLKDLEKMLKSRHSLRSASQPMLQRLVMRGNDKSACDNTIAELQKFVPTIVITKETPQRRRPPPGSFSDTDGASDDDSGDESS